MAISADRCSRAERRGTHSAARVTRPRSEGSQIRSREGENFSPGEHLSDPRIYLSVPHMSGHELPYVEEAFRSNWLSSVGPNLEGFEREMEQRLGGGMHALAVASGTAALHMTLRYIGVERGSKVAVQSLTFAGSIFPILYQGAEPVFIDSERDSMNIDPALVEEYLEDAARRNELPVALIAVHLYGQHADIDRIAAACDRYGVVLVEDAAESLGSTYKGRQTGTTAPFSIISFNGNKIITTTGGGMCVARDSAAIARMRKWSTQSKEPGVGYTHVELGYNYRMSNVLAGIGRGQLRVLDERVAQRRRVAERYAAAFADLPGIDLQPDSPWGLHTRWMSVAFLDRSVTSLTGEGLVSALEDFNIEARPLWRPTHAQPMFAGARRIGGAVAEDFYGRGICLPCSSSLSESDQGRVIAAVRHCVEASLATAGVP
jgi:pyridoxal phosphate-dependent aminotransferase EpsN